MISFQVVHAQKSKKRKFGLLNAVLEKIEKRDIGFGLYIGGPNAFTGKLRELAVEQNLSSSEVSGTIPIGFRTETRLFGRIYSGFDISYAKSSITWADIGPTNETFYTTSTITRIRYIWASSYHFGNPDKVEWYTGWAGGYAVNPINVTQSDENSLLHGTPRLETVYAVEDLQTEVIQDVPYALRIYMGTYFHLTNSIKLNFEVGAGGGPLAKAGIYFEPHRIK